MKFNNCHLLILSGFLTLTVLGFKTDHLATPKLSKKDSMVSDSLHIGEANQKWMHLMNTEVDRLGELYTENAVKVNASGEVLEGNLTIMETYSHAPTAIDSIHSLHTYRAVLDNTITYEIGRFWTPEQEFAHLIIWRKRDGTLKRELEFVAPLRNTLPMENEIDTSRQQWMTLCNAHDARHLVNALYTDNALYYNHKPMVMGKAAITEAYRYMNDPDYQLVLEPFVVELISANLAFEIGQCSGSYPGNYVLIWEKGEAGAWRILFDSNI